MVFWGLVIFAITCYLILSNLSFQFALLDTLSLSLFLLIFTSLIYSIQRNYHTKKALDLQNSSTIFLFSVLVALFNVLLLNSYDDSDLYDDSWEILLTVKFLFVLLFLIVSLLLFWIDEQKKQEAHFQEFVTQKAKESGRIQLNSLQQQFQPHFLFNSLNSINALTISNPEEAQKMVQLLSEFMRGAVKDNQSEKVNLEEEIHHIKLYASIEKVRFGDRLTVEFLIPNECLSFKIPSLILQPIIENAIKYGLYGNLDKVIIQIRARTENKSLIIEVQNPVDRSQATVNKGTGYGLSSIRKKMLILYNRSNLLETKEENGIFTTTLQIPQE